MQAPTTAVPTTPKDGRSQPLVRLGLGGFIGLIFSGGETPVGLKFGKTLIVLQKVGRVVRYGYFIDNHNPSSRWISLTNKFFPFFIIVITNFNLGSVFLLHLVTITKCQ